MTSEKNAPYAFETSLTEVKQNIYLVDWLTVVVYGYSLDDVFDLFGFDSSFFKPMPRGLNGYPARLFFDGVSILYGNDDPSLVPIDKLRYDMGICINMSGQGCRCFESSGHGDWTRLFKVFLTLTGTVRECNGRKYSHNITRLDLAYDDHEGLFDINTIAQKVYDRDYRSPFKSSSVTWSDNQEFDIKGLTINIGSPSSMIMYRIYDKAAERGFKDRHWIRIEIQMRDDRAILCARDLTMLPVSDVFRGITKEYLLFLDPCHDLNKSRWNVCDWWRNWLDHVDSVQLTMPGREYNFDKTKYYHMHQYGQFLAAMSYLYDPEYIYSVARGLYPDFDSLSPKYQNVIRLNLMEGVRNENYTI